MMFENGAAPTPPAFLVDHAIDPIEEERSRLEAELAVAKTRLLAAQHAGAQLDAQTKQTIRAELAGSRETLSQLDSEHAEAVRLVRSNAEREVAAIIAEAHRRAADIDDDLIPDWSQP